MASMYYNTLLLSHYYELAQAFTLLHLKVKQLLFFIAVTGSVKVFTITIQPIGDVLGDKKPNFG